ncbi:MAG: hypothetical protein R3Y62_00370, partial [Eubacteriales bacterium]
MLTAEQIKEVKGLGFLNQKGTECFNGRIITGNGKITAEKIAIIAQAAEKFGDGEVTLTGRMTFEIQGVPYDSIQPLRAFLGEHGLETG